MAMPESTVGATAESLVLLLSDVERRVTRRLAQVLAHEGCSVERWRVLALLSGGDRHRMTELAEVTQLPPASLTRLIDGMVADNLVHRKADPRDRRSVLVHLTQRGRATRRRVSERIAAGRDAIFADVDEDALASALASLAGGVARPR
jgi:DNA-binding MarR family transcriptional regulator